MVNEFSYSHGVHCFSVEVTSEVGKSCYFALNSYNNEFILCLLMILYINV